MDFQQASTDSTPRGARLLSLEELQGLLADPESKEPLKLQEGQLINPNSGKAYSVLDGLPLLAPEVLAEFITKNGWDIPWDKALDPALQYYVLSQVKIKTDSPNLDTDSPWYKKHIQRTLELLKTARGTVLDIGCDSPSRSAGLFPETCSYVGLDPLIESNAEFRIIGLAERLPFSNDSFDGTLLSTSLDHVLDWHEALLEARRVLRQGGKLFLSTLVWEKSADLFRDTEHFHHFRQFEILGALEKYDFRVLRMQRYNWKNNTHRSGLYLEAEKV